MCPAKEASARSLDSAVRPADRARWRDFGFTSSAQGHISQPGVSLLQSNV